MMEIVMWICGIMLGLATLACVIRVAKGPSILDRVLALDVMLLIISVALCLEMVYNRHTDYLLFVIAAATNDPGSSTGLDGSLKALRDHPFGPILLLAIGAGFIYWDIADIEDLRDKVRKGVGFDVYGGETDADKEIEGWVAEVLARKDGYGNLKDEIVDKLMELEQKERAKQEAQAMLGVQKR